ncbi:MAG TPA: alpha/beta hydrolase [Opitutae bacterium]|nr:alpha/beta hydrolase [Opitutae bacterium]
MPLIEQSSYRSPFALSHGHVQTIFPTLFRPLPVVSYERERIETPDGDFLDLDWQRKESSKQLVIITHGLEGSSNGKYVRGMARAFQRKGWHSLAWNLRGCSGEPNRLLTSYHSGSSHDLDAVIHHAMQLDHYETIALVGFSLGGNITLKYLGDLGDHVSPKIKSAVAFSVATDLASSAKQLESFANRIYMRRFLNTLTTKVRLKIQQFPNQIEDHALDQMRTFREFDGHYTAPLNGFASAEEYWQKCSCGNMLNNISVTTLLVNAKNDPFLTPQCFPAEVAADHPYFHFEAPATGGHMGFLQFQDENEYWAEQRAVEFVQDHT